MGFHQLGKSSFDHNRSLRNKRTTVQDHPYFGKGERKGDPNPYGQELKDWQQEKARKAARLQQYIYAALLLMIILLSLWVGLS